MKLDVRTGLYTHASPDYLYNECAVFVDGVKVDHVISLDTEAGVVIAWDPGVGWKAGTQLTFKGHVEYCQLMFAGGDLVES